MLKEVYILQLIFVLVDIDLNVFEQVEDLIEFGGLFYDLGLKFEESDNIYILLWYFYVLCSDCM